MNEGLCQHLHVGYWRLNNGANIYTVVTFFVNGGYCLIHEFEPQTVICDGGGSIIGQICVTSFKNIPIGLLPFLLFSYVLGDNKDTFSFPLPGSVFRGRNWTFESGDAK